MNRQVDLRLLYKMPSRHCVCGKIASYRFPGQPCSHCASCKLPGMESKRRKCPCGTIPNFGYPGSPATYCVKCKTDDMVNVVTKKCLCGKQPCFGLPGKSATCCVSCKTTDMINVVATYCECGSNKTKSYAESMESKPTHCSECKADTMVCVYYKRCSCGSGVGMTFGFLGEQASCCGSCRQKGMINVKANLCPCGKQPTYGEDGKRPVCCFTCKEPHMVAIRKDLCPCGTRPQYGFPTDKKPSCCASCKTKGMIDIIAPHCLTEGCDTIVTDKFKGYCMKCFIKLFPDVTITRKYKVKENTVVDFIKELHTSDIIPSKFTIAYDKQISGGKSRRKPDVYINCEDHVVIVEIDEKQHSETEYQENDIERRRIQILYEDAGSRPARFLRFNPDKFVDSMKRKIPTCFQFDNSLDAHNAGVTDKVGWEYRLSVLKEYIIDAVNNIPDDPITIDYLFYDGCEYGLSPSTSI